MKVVQARLGSPEGRDVGLPLPRRAVKAFEFEGHAVPERAEEPRLALGGVSVSDVREAIGRSDDANQHHGGVSAQVRNPHHTSRRSGL